MTLMEFASLKKDEQIHVIKNSGTFLFIRHEGSIDVVLYQIKSFYAEVYFEGANKKNIRIKSFDDTSMLDIYLQEISLSELRDLL